MSDYLRNTMSYIKDIKIPTYPAPASAGAPPGPDIQVEDPEARRQQPASERTNSLFDWLTQVVKHEPTTTNAEREQKHGNTAIDKDQGPSESSDSLSWLLEADNHSNLERSTWRESGAPSKAEVIIENAFARLKVKNAVLAHFERERNQFEAEMSKKEWQGVKTLVNGQYEDLVEMVKREREGWSKDSDKGKG